MGLIFIWDPRYYCSTEGRGLYLAGDHLFSSNPWLLAVFFIDRPQNPLQKNYQSLPDKEAEAEKALCLGHQADKW